MANVKKCEACLGKVEGFPTIKVQHGDGRRGVIHANWSCQSHAEKQGYKEIV